jgi:hypothetical protein
MYLVSQQQEVLDGADFDASQISGRRNGVWLEEHGQFA